MGEDHPLTHRPVEWLLCFTNFGETFWHVKRMIHLGCCLALGSDGRASGGNLSLAETGDVWAIGGRPFCPPQGCRVVKVGPTRPINFWDA